MWGSVGGVGQAAPLGLPRFKVGDSVQCKVGMVGDNWENGRIAAVGYREAHFPPGFVAPYQVQLASGQLIYAPYDRDDIVRKRDGEWF